MVTLRNNLRFLLAGLVLAVTGAEPARCQDTGWRFGTEVDALPFAMGGYYGSAFAAKEGWRVRGVAARSRVPGFLVSEGFRDKRSDAYAVLVDRFLGPKAKEMEGLWIGGGVEWWRNRVRLEGREEYTKYNNTMATVGGGYVWRFSRHFYLNPWAGGHVVVGGERSIAVSGKRYEQPRFTPEFSVKLGIVF